MNAGITVAAIVGFMAGIISSQLYLAIRREYKQKAAMEKEGRGFQCKCTHDIYQHMMLEEPDITANELFESKNLSGCQMTYCGCGNYQGNVPDVSDVEKMKSRSSQTGEGNP